MQWIARGKQPFSTLLNRVTSIADLNNISFIFLIFSLILGVDEAIIKLLQYGAKWDQETLELIPPDTLERFFDSCIEDVLGSGNIGFSYPFLMPISSANKNQRYNVENSGNPQRKKSIFIDEIMINLLSKI